MAEKTSQFCAFQFYMPRRFTAGTKERFWRINRRALAAHCGGRPSYDQQILIVRIIRNAWDLFRQDAQMDAGELSPHGMRVRLAAENRIRLDLRELGKLGLKPAAPAAPSLAGFLRSAKAEGVAR
jgi:hypothetical protein